MVTLNAFSADKLPENLEIASVKLLGDDDPVEWEMNETGLAIIVPFMPLGSGHPDHREGSRRTFS